MSVISRGNPPKDRPAPANQKSMMGSMRSSGRSWMQGTKSDAKRIDSRQVELKICQMHEELWNFYTQLLHSFSTNVADILENESGIFEIRLQTILEMIEILLICPTCSKKTAKQILSKYFSFVLYLNLYWTCQIWSKEEYLILFRIMNLLKRVNQWKENYDKIKKQTKQLYKNRIKDKNSKDKSSILDNQSGFRSEIEYQQELIVILLAFFLLIEIVEAQASQKQEYVWHLFTFLHQQPEENKRQLPSSVNKIICGVMDRLNLTKKLGFGKYSYSFQKQVILVPKFRAKASHNQQKAEDKSIPSQSSSTVLKIEPDLQAQKPRPDLKKEKSANSSNSQRPSLSEAEIIEFERATFESMLNFIERLTQDEKIPEEQSKIIAGFSNFNVRFHYQSQRRLNILQKMLQLSRKCPPLVAITLSNAFSLLQTEQVFQKLDLIRPFCTKDSQKKIAQYINKKLKPQYAAIAKKFGY